MYSYNLKLTFQDSRLRVLTGNQLKAWMDLSSTVEIKDNHYEKKDKHKYAQQTKKTLPHS